MITSKISCDTCGKEKPESARWWIVKPTATDFTILPWGSGAVNNTIAQHLCSQNCVAQASKKWMSEYLQRPSAE